MIDFTVENIKRVKRILTPYRFSFSDKAQEYRDGWYDCIKEINRSYRKYVLPVFQLKQLG